MGRRKLTIEETRVKNLPYINGSFVYSAASGERFAICKVSVPTGKRGRKPVVFEANPTATSRIQLDAELCLSDAMRVIADAAAVAGGSNE